MFNTTNLPKWKVHLCANCIKDLKGYYPYTMPQDDLDITLVSEDQCDNVHLDNYNERLSARNADYIAAHTQEASK